MAPGPSSLAHPHAAEQHMHMARLEEREQHALEREGKVKPKAAKVGQRRRKPARVPGG
jgi:hypothetical protein